MLKNIVMTFTRMCTLNSGRLEFPSVDDQNANIVLFFTFWPTVLPDLSCLSFAVPLLAF